MILTKIRLDDLAATLSIILLEQPELTAAGFWTGRDRNIGYDRRVSSYRDGREAMVNDRNLIGFAVARQWLHIQRKLRTNKINRLTGTSYRLKKAAEPSTGRLSNGAFIAAAIAEDYQIERAGDGPNAWLNISSKALLVRNPPIVLEHF